METALQHEQQQQQPKEINTSEDPISVPTLLPEIFFEILLRLPVESLLRCKAVCKLWNSLISDHHFIKSHLILSTRNNDYLHHKLFFYALDGENVIKSYPVCDLLHEKPVNAIELDYPLKHPYEYVCMAGACNGLLIIVTGRDELYIWNPSTKRLNRLPHCFEERRGWYALYGFGYDESTDDYKVVGISCVVENKANHDSKVMIYSLKTGNWKTIGDFPHGMPSDESGIFSNGALHWASSHGYRTIVSLDLAKETYGEVLQPAYDQGDKHLMLGILGGRLCVHCYYHGNRVDVWAMNVYGVKDSWTKLITIPYLTVIESYLFLVPLCISKDGKVLLKCRSKLLLYDTKNRSFSEIQYFHECLQVQAYIIVESLVSPGSPSTTALGNNKDGN